MANKRFFAGILVMALVFGITFIACDNGSTDNTDSALNGTWVSSYSVEIKLDKGNYEASRSGSLMSKGTYTTKDGKITITLTHVWGKAYDNSLESKWYSKADLKAALGIPDAQLDSMFTSQTETYSVSGNKLTIGSGNDQDTYTKKQQ